MSTSIDILSFDAYYFAHQLSLYPQAVQGFLERGGILAWGIVPTDPEDAARETVESLLARFDEGVGYLVGRGLDRELVLDRVLFTPSCGLGSRSVAGAAQVFALTRSLSETWRARHGRAYA